MASSAQISRFVTWADLGLAVGFMMDEPLWSKIGPGCGA
jgi:hypothetical protein